ncbi:mRNA turnover and ribosome assembly protein [Lithohypha guttulata]|uniref:Ribosome assembly factor mrt4 n=2 Tax=Lithohypha guttulata TaxID=1690604 RepID=A0AAN7SZQ9_9EURO|nr:mRNA turnover and ribosome assembly protein [Lithohypha guttulata]KAK5085504.1 mRNA turnover and ribosome assembly protein [Lithohypha guttulata]KAK5103612.1 mRNA turnover and ribosome assembly protein [Lithohypha guttulata]
MPSSKRNRVVTTSKTKKNHKELVKRLHTNIQEAAEKYSYIWVFGVENVRNNFIKQVRVDFADSRIFMGKTKVMQVALGRNKESECVPGASGLVSHMKGEVGLLFTDRQPQEVQDYFETYSELDYARSGAVAAQGFRIPPGELHTAYGVEGGEEDPLPMSIEPTLRRLGVPTKIVKGKVTLEDRPEDSMDTEEGYEICKEGDILNSTQTSILKIFGVRMSEFKMGLSAVYDKEKESVTVVAPQEAQLP